MKEITFVHPTSKITRTIKVCEIQKEIVDVIRKRRIFNDGSIFVLYDDGSYFFQLLGSDGHKAGQFRRCGIKAATVSSFSGELFVFGDFAITPDGLVCIGEENIKKYGSYSGQYDVQPEKVETNTETKAETKKEARIIDYLSDLFTKGYSLDCNNSFIREVNAYNFETGNFDILTFSNSDVFSCNKQAVIRFARYLSRR